MAIINSILNNLTNKAYFNDMEVKADEKRMVMEHKDLQQRLMEKLDKDFFENEMEILKNLMGVKFNRLVNGAKNPDDEMNVISTSHTYANAYIFMHVGDKFDVFSYRTKKAEETEDDEEDLYDFLNSYFDEDFYRTRSDDEETHFHKAKKSKRAIRRKSMSKDKAKHGRPKHYSKWCKGKVYLAGDKYSYEKDNWVKLEMGAI